MLNRSGQATIGLIGLVFFLLLFVVLVFLRIPINTAFIIVLAAMIFTASFVNTDIALVILIFSMLLSPEFSAGHITGRSVKIRADDIFLIVIFFGWMAKMAINKELGALKATPLNTPIMIYIIVCFFSSFIAILQGRVIFKEFLFFILKYIEYFMLFFMVVNNLKSMQQARRFILFLFITCFFVCIYGLTQAHTTERISAPFESHSEPNTFAGYLVFMMGLIIASILYPERTTNQFLFVGLLGMAGIALLLTLSRSGWLSFFSMFLVLILLNKKFRMQLIIVFIIGAICVPIFAPSSVHKRVQETFVGPRSYKLMGSRVAIDESGQARIDSWGIGFRRWVQRPILGYGIPAGVVIDNQYTRVLNETGIIGFGAFLWILITIFGVVRRTYLAAGDNNFVLALCAGFLAGFGGLLLLSSAAAVFIIIRIMEPFWFVLGIIVALPDIAAGEFGKDVHPVKA